MKNIFSLSLLALALTACSSTAPTTQAVVSAADKAVAVVTAPVAMEASPSELTTIGKQLAQGCAAGDKNLCDASAQVVAFLSGSNASSSIAPSFNCAKAGTPVEHLVCDSKPLSSLDGIMARQYKVVSKSASAKQVQKDWLNNTRNACADVECLAVEYSKRIVSLSN